MKIADLKKELKKSGLPVTGNKQELIERLQAAEGTSLLDENDDDLDQEDDQMTEEAIKEAEKELQVQGDTSFTEEPTPEPEKTEEKKTVASPAKETVEEAKAEDSAEKIKARAERFGGFQSDEAKKAARAARFSDMMTEMKGNETSKKIGAAPAVDLDLLKKRAERFGSAVSPLVKEAEISDAIKRRQDRFGVVTKDEPKPKKISLNAGVNSVVLDEKIKARQERFAVV